MDITKEELYSTIPVCFQKGFLDNDLTNLMFYMYFLQLTHIDFDGKENGTPTAGAGLIGNHYKVTINPEFWLNKAHLPTVEKRVTLLIHECIHIVEQDCYLDKDYDDHMLYNIAIDLKANSVIIDANCEKHLPGEGNTKIWRSTYEKRIQDLINDVKNETLSRVELAKQLDKIPCRPVHPDDYADPDINVKNCIEKGTMWIYNKLKEDQRKQNQGVKINIFGGNQDDSEDVEAGGSSNGSSGNKNDSDSDDNDSNNSDDTQSLSVTVQMGSNPWVNANALADQDPTNNSFTDFDEIPDAQRDFAANQLEHIVSQVLESLENSGKSMGTLPAGLKRLIDKIKNPPKPVYNWQQHCRKYVSMHGRRTLVSRTYTKPSFFIDENPRLKFTPDLYMLCALDTSGSMNQKDLVEVLSELYNIRKVLSGNLDLCTMDTGIYNISEIRKESDINAYVEKHGLYGGGGTYIEPFIEEFNKNPKYSYGIYLTDGEVSESRIKNIKPYMVLLTSSGRIPKWDNVPVVQIPKDYFKNKNSQ